MAGLIDARLEELGIDLPRPPDAAGSYVGHVRAGALLFLAGQIPFRNGELTLKGKVGGDLTVEQGREAARICALNLIAQAKTALDGDLDRITRFVKLGGFVNCPADFTEHPKVINGASDLIARIFGEKIGAHARFALGAGSLPLNAAVEIDAVIEAA